MAARVDSSLSRVVLLAALSHYHLVLVVVRVRLQLVFFFQYALNISFSVYLRTSPIVALDDFEPLRLLVYLFFIYDFNILLSFKHFLLQELFGLSLIFL